MLEALSLTPKMERALWLALRDDPYGLGRYDCMTSTYVALLRRGLVQSLSCPPSFRAVLTPKGFQTLEALHDLEYAPPAGE